MPSSPRWVAGGGVQRSAPAKGLSGSGPITTSVRSVGPTSTEAAWKSGIAGRAVHSVGSASASAVSGETAPDDAASSSDCSAGSH
jgi:hypothetical protein